MKPEKTTVAELLEHCLKMMAKVDTDTLEIDFGVNDNMFTFEIRLVALNGAPATEDEE